jgi:hypothetical protein
MHCLLLCVVLLVVTCAQASDSTSTSIEDATVGISRSQPVSSTEPRTNWDNLIRSSARFLAVQHGFRLLTEPGTRKEISGPFVRDYLRSVGAMRRWGDSDPFIVNYVGHPLMGAVTGFLYLQNTDAGKDQRFQGSPEYWRLRLGAMTYSAVYSTQFEIGPASEAAIGNVGRDYRTMGTVDLVVTPLAGTGWLVAEDIIDRFLIERIEGWSGSPFVRIPARCFLNPGRAFANLMQGRSPWRRSRALRSPGPNRL